MVWFDMIPHHLVCLLFRYVTMQNLELVASKMSELCQFSIICMVWFGLVMFWFGLVSILIIWCVPIVQIYYHAKSEACSFKNYWVIFVLVLLGLVWYGVVLLVIVLYIFTIINIVVSNILGVLAKTAGFYQVPVLSYPYCHCRHCCCHSHCCCCCCCHTIIVVIVIDVFDVLVKSPCLYMRFPLCCIALP